MGTLSWDRDSETRGLAIRLVIAELRAFRRVIAEASLSDSVVVSRWSRSTLPNVLHHVAASDRIAGLVHEARARAEAFEMGLMSPFNPGPNDDVDALRREAAGSLEHLIAVLGTSNATPLVAG